MNFEVEALEQPTSHDKFIDYTDPVVRQKAIEGRKRATPIGVFYRAIGEKCRECWPYQSDCEAHDNCHLYNFRNSKLRTRIRKADIRRAIRLECRECVGTSSDNCTSPDCALYPGRFGRNPRRASVSEQ